MALINTSFFYGELSIAQVSNSEVAASLNLIIDYREEELLTRLFGYEFYKAYKAGILANTQIYKDIRDGKEYTDLSGNLTKWMGLSFTIGTAKKSLIANYIYWWYLKDNYTFTTGSSEKKTATAINVSPDHKMVRAWNEMVEWNQELYCFLISNKSIYPEFEGKFDKHLFTHQNRLGF